MSTTSALFYLRVLTFSATLKPLEKDFVNANKFDDLQRSCSRSLTRLQNESRQTLNLLASVTHFPVTIEKRTAVDLQRRRENAAQHEYTDLMRSLFKLLAAIPLI